MKKILIVNNNMKVGGVQKSLLNLLWELGENQDVTLYLFRAVGAYLEQLPPWVRVVESKGLFRLLGISQGECRGAEKWLRGGLVILCRVLGYSSVMKLLLAGQRKLREEYDCAISFLHNGNPRHFYGGTQDFVLHKVRAGKKIAFLHCDYRNCGGHYPANDRQLHRFDAIAACSDGCREAFLEVLPELSGKCVTVRNCHRFVQIRELAEDAPVHYDQAYCNVVMVSRLSKEKGIQRAMEAIRFANEHGCKAMLHLVGGGGQEAHLKEIAVNMGVVDLVRFYGEQTNPYRYMKNADLFLMTSYHEAAPMVIEEAACLGVPVLTTKTTSSEDMVSTAGIGWVCENNDGAIHEALLRVLEDRQTLERKKAEMQARKLDNHLALGQFAMLIKK